MKSGKFRVGSIDSIVSYNVTDRDHTKERITMNPGEFHIETIRPNVILIDDCTDSSAYLILGTHTALLVDTGMGGDNFPEVVRSLTDLPITLFITHAHPDHHRYAASFAPVYLHQKDYDILTPMRNEVDPLTPDASVFTPVEEGFRIDLGGATAIVYWVGGHTPGSAAVVIPEYEIVCTGDAFGSGVGVWMQVPFALNMAEYRDMMAHYLDVCAYTRDYLYLGGHIKQSEHNPLCYQLVGDMYSLAWRLLERHPEQITRPSRGRAFTDEQPMGAAFRTASMVYLNSQL